MEWQIEQTLIRLNLKEQSDLGLHCLPKPVWPKTWGHHGIAYEGFKQKSQVLTCLRVNFPVEYFSFWCIFLQFANTGWSGKGSKVAMDSLNTEAFSSIRNSNKPFDWNQK